MGYQYEGGGGRIYLRVNFPIYNERYSKLFDYLWYFTIWTISLFLEAVDVVYLNIETESARSQI